LRARGGIDYYPTRCGVFLNGLLSKEGQLKWQEKSHNNTLRTDIPKAMLSDLNAQGKCVNTSLPQYQDVDAALKIVDETLGKAGKK
jgi:hypothetical protein